MVLNRSVMKSLSTITLPEVASLEISFPSMSEGCLLVCSIFHAYIPSVAKLIHLLSGMLYAMVLPYTNAVLHSSLCGFIGVWHVRH